MTTITMEKHILKRLDALEDFAKEIRAALAAPATAPEFPADWAQMIHYPECWDTAAYPELRDAIHEALAWSGCSVCKPATAPAWHDAPTVPGLWWVAGTAGIFHIDEAALPIYKGSAHRWFGPIPPDSGDKP